MLYDLRTYVPKMSRSLAMLPEEIQRLVDTTMRKSRRLIQTFADALHWIVGYAIKVSKRNDKSWLTEWEYKSPAGLDMFWKSIQEDIPDIVIYTPYLDMSQEFYSDDIKLAWEAVTKHFWWHSEYPVQDNNLEMQACIREALMTLSVHINQEPH